MCQKATLLWPTMRCTLAVWAFGFDLKVFFSNVLLEIIIYCVLDSELPSSTCYWISGLICKHLLCTFLRSITCLMSIKQKMCKEKIVWHSQLEYCPCQVVLCTTLLVTGGWRKLRTCVQLWNSLQTQEYVNSLSLQTQVNSPPSGLPDVQENLP